VSSLLSERRSLCEIRVLYRPLSEKWKCDRLRPNNSKSRRYDRILHTSFLTVIRRLGRDKNRGTTPIKAGTVRFGPRVFNQIHLVRVKGSMGRSRQNGPVLQEPKYTDQGRDDHLGIPGYLERPD
jgi:hypothetical protein